MPIKIPDLLPAVDVLGAENVFVMTETRAAHQDVRPLKVLILNLMPKKIETENQLIRMLANSPLQVDVELLRIDNRESKNTSTQHLNSFYRNFEQVRAFKYDGLIITGAPLGLVQFEDIHYWDKIQEIIRWSQESVTSTLFLCWAAQAALKVLYDLPKQTRDEKLSGIYQHQILTQHEPLIRGFDDCFLVPHSRNADFPVNFITNHTDLHVLASSEEAGAYLMASACRRQVYVTGHPEYDAETLSQEYWRDMEAGISPKIPVNYFPDDNPDNHPPNVWRSHANLMFTNWLNYYVYQITPYELNPS
ncbi:MAG: homoserine O-succinyltransferase [Motiliproteus sp.]|nr:homoserine O-succinyltransferase [Motiliproteus sp.]MCW9054196.1 homoserine O-succinyltransferase [Motiliproteus sp.]